MKKRVSVICFAERRWGIGTYIHDSEKVYGYAPMKMNPYNFKPDLECCTLEEIDNWEEDKLKWEKNHE